MDHVFGVRSKNLRSNHQFPGPKGFSPMCVYVCVCVFSGSVIILYLTFQSVTNFCVS